MPFASRATDVTLLRAAERDVPKSLFVLSRSARAVGRLASKLNRKSVWAPPRAAHPCSLGRSQ